MDYPCSICFRNVVVNVIVCNCCNQWTHRKCANLTIAKLEIFSHTKEDWFCKNFTLLLFPFSQITDDEFIYLSMGIDHNLLDLFDKCSDLNYEPFKHVESKDYFVTDKIDPDNNLHNKLSVSSLYYTEDQFKRKFITSRQGIQQFSLIHFNCRSLPSNCSKLDESISALDFEFDVIALSETWLKDNDHDNYNMEGYSMFTCSRVDENGGGVAL